MAKIEDVTLLVPVPVRVITLPLGGVRRGVFGSLLFSTVQETLLTYRVGGSGCNNIATDFNMEGFQYRCTAPVGEAYCAEAVAAVFLRVNQRNGADVVKVLAALYTVLRDLFSVNYAEGVRLSAAFTQAEIVG